LRTLVFADPPLVNFVQRNGIQVMEFFTPAPDRGHEVGGFQQEEMLGNGLPRHVEIFAKIAQRSPVVLVQNIQQLATAGIRQCFKHLVHAQG